MDVQDVKNILGIDHTDTDHYIFTVLPLTIDFVKGYCGVDFLIPNPNYNPNDPTDSKDIEDFRGAKLAIAKIIEFNMHEAGVTSENISKVSTSFTTEIPQSIYQLLEPYKKTKARFF